MTLPAGGAAHHLMDDADFEVRCRAHAWEKRGAQFVTRIRGTDHCVMSFFFFFSSILPPKLAELSDHVDFWEQAELRGELGWVGFYLVEFIIANYFYEKWIQSRIEKLYRGMMERFLGEESNETRSVKILLSYRANNLRRFVIFSFD